MIRGGPPLFGRNPIIMPEPEPEPEDFEVPDPVISMRFKRLVDSGYNDWQALYLATDRRIDLHKAEDMAVNAGSDLAFSILR